MTNLASVIGRIVNIQTGQLAVGVTVQIGDRKAISATNGSFVITDVTEGEHTITFSSPEYRGYSRTIKVAIPLSDLGEFLILPRQLIELPKPPF
ncbi:MAG: hypothetical protein RMK18_07240 [Armatimonadota bacterium]|nr:carboxypeptidase-like regulatory domain-containing protein [Armatimonadota bacterium]MDW8025643.1 hypothetical protein [Armatimonadota bacterium]